MDYGAVLKAFDVVKACTMRQCMVIELGCDGVDHALYHIARMVKRERKTTQGDGSSRYAWLWRP